MGPTLTRTVAIVVGAVAVFGSVRLPAAQNFPADPLAVRMPDDAVEANVESIVTIAVRLGVPLGFEAAGALRERVSGLFRPGPDGARPKPLVSVRPTPLDVRGVPLRHALDAAVAKDRRYEWREMDGVVVVRPRAAWNDPRHPLHLPSDVSTGTLLGLLNEEARTRGGTHWALTSEVRTILLDRGLALTVSRAVITVDGPAGSREIPLWR